MINTFRMEMWNLSKREQHDKRTGNSRLSPIYGQTRVSDATNLQHGLLIGPNNGCIILHRRQEHNL